MRWWVVVVVWLAGGMAWGQEVYPPRVHLHGPGARQKVMVVRQKSEVTKEITDEAKLVSSRPGVVKVVDGAWLEAVGDGESTITSPVFAGGSIAVKVTGTVKAEPPSFVLDVIPILTRIGCNAGSCHGALAGKGGLKLSLRGYDPESDYHVLTRQALGRRVDLGHPELSLMLQKPAGKMTHGGGKKLEEASQEYATLKRWIDAGAPGAQPDQASLQRIEVYPPTALLQPESGISSIVQAVYSDGRTVDVTRLAKFGSSDNQVLKVSDDGQLTALGHGAAAATVLYSNLVAILPVLSPYPAAPGQEGRRYERNNFIDDEVNRRLVELRLPASPGCSDQEFIRRLYLDALGVLPTPEEVAAFLADKSNQKREKLIDQVLGRPEYIDYWTYKWSDLLLISTKKLPQSNVWAFYQFVRQTVAENVPWDRFARQIMTAQGSNLENGAANYFVMHKDISDLSETTSITFMGTSITCARCHNHPLEKWTQDQYWQMANLFGRVGMKNGERGNEVIVQSMPEGEVLHLRRGVPMPPTPLDGKAMKLSDAQDRRGHFATWLTSKENPYFARALVNRVWRNFMGLGLIEAEDDIRQTNPPSNPGLLAALEQDFIMNGYDVKRLIKTIVTSAAYQRSARPVAGNEQDDRYYSKYLIRRLKAEVILDVYSQVTGVPTPFNQLESGGRDAVTPTSEYPLGMRAMQLADTKVVSRFLTSFGRPERDQACSCEREADATVGQALHLNNGQTLNDKLRGKNSRVEQWINEKISDGEAVDRLFRLALGRQPSPEEKKRFVAIMGQGSDRREVLEDLFWAVLSGKEFVFNH